MRADHPRDVWVEITTLGDPTPRRILAVDGHELDLRDAKDAYVLGRITFEEFDRALDEMLKADPSPSDPPSWICADCGTTTGVVACPTHNAHTTSPIFGIVHLCSPCRDRRLSPSDPP